MSRYKTDSTPVDLVKRDISVQYGSRKMELQVDPDAPIYNMKLALQEKTGLPVHEIKMYYTGPNREFDDTKSLRHYGLQFGGYFHMDRKDKEPVAGSAAPPPPALTRGRSEESYLPPNHPAPSLKGASTRNSSTPNQKKRVDVMGSPSDSDHTTSSVQVINQTYLEEEQTIHQKVQADRQADVARQQIAAKKAAKKAARSRPPQKDKDLQALVRKKAAAAEESKRIRQQIEQERLLAAAAQERTMREEQQQEMQEEKERQAATACQAAREADEKLRHDALQAKRRMDVQKRRQRELEEERRLEEAEEKRKSDLEEHRRRQEAEEQRQRQQRVAEEQRQRELEEKRQRDQEEKRQRELEHQRQREAEAQRHRNEAEGKRRREAEARRRRITVETQEGKMFTLVLDKDDAIENVKKAVASDCQVLRVPTQQVLSFNGRRLDNNQDTLDSLGIPDGARLMVGPTKVPVTVKTRDGKRIELLVDPTRDCISDLKQQLEDEAGVPANHQALFTKGVVELTDPNKTAGGYGIKAGSVIDLEQKIIQVSVQTPDRRTSSVQVNPYDTDLDTPNTAEMSVEKKRKCYMWYARLGQPSRDQMIGSVQKLSTSCDITIEDVNALPWMAGGAMLPVKEMNNLFMTG